jgi:hypothetical protein
MSRYSGVLQAKKVWPFEGLCHLLILKGYLCPRQAASRRPVGLVLKSLQIGSSYWFERYPVFLLLFGQGWKQLCRKESIGCDRIFSESRGRLISKVGVSSHRCKAIEKRSKVSFGANRPFQGYPKSAIPFRHTGQPERGSLFITFSRQHGPFVLSVSRSLVYEGSTG